jgi:predicted O-linked N-acetylglucosamine transferase (SPINDLY family)
MEASGVAVDRVDFVLPRPPLEYLSAHHHVDVALDTFPYGAHTTGLDAFWMGVPVPTIAGRMPVARAGVSHLRNLDLNDLIAADEDEYVSTVVELCQNLPKLSNLRRELRPRMLDAPLMNARGFARAIEEAFQRMWHERRG